VAADVNSGFKILISYPFFDIITLLGTWKEIEAMPIYEYQCLGCEIEFQKLILKKEEENDLLCPNCGGRDIKRLISRVAYHSSEADRLASFDPNARQTDSFYSDSRNIGLSAQKRAQQMGVDLGEGFNDKVEKLRTDPGSVFKDIDWLKRSQS